MDNEMDSGDGMNSGAAMIQQAPGVQVIVENTVIEAPQPEVVNEASEGADKGNMKPVLEVILIILLVVLVIVGIVVGVSKLRESSEEDDEEEF